MLDGPEPQLKCKPDIISSLIGRVQLFSIVKYTVQATRCQIIIYILGI